LLTNWDCTRNSRLYDAFMQPSKRSRVQIPELETETEAAGAAGAA